MTGMTAPDDKNRVEPTAPNSTVDAQGNQQGSQGDKPLTPAAQRALAEAAARRAERERLAKEAPQQPTELSGRGGLDPARYGDWEIKGIASDF